MPEPHFITSCETDQCPSQGVPIEIIGAADAVICGLCNQEVVNVSEPFYPPGTDTEESPA